nr:MAG TPA: hypothetical protein [Caudoviricetes sp.]
MTGWSEERLHQFDAIFFFALKQKIGVRAEAEPLKKSFDFFQCTTILAPCRYTSTITCYSLCVVFLLVKHFVSQLL